MSTDRRTFLTALGAMAVAGCAGESESDDPSNPGETGGDGDTGDTGLADDWTWEPGPEPDALFEPALALDATRFAWGVQTGDATAETVVIQGRSLLDEVEVVVHRFDGEAWLEVAREIAQADEGVVRLDLAGLVPDATHCVHFEAEGSRSRVSRFRTALYPGAQRVVRFGAVSCLGDTNAPFPSMSQASTYNLDLFLLLGDTIYADSAWGNDGGFEPLWDQALEERGLQDMLASTSSVSIWDDHEVVDNWNPEDPQTAALAAESLDAFRRALPQREGPNGVLWRSLVWGDTLEVFVLDCRGERLDGNYISPAQMDWLKQGLSQSTARFKIIMNSVPITDMTTKYGPISAEDRWDGFPEQRSEILGHIVDEAIEGVLWVGGDFHWGAVTHVGRPGDRFFDIREVFAGPGGSFMNPAVYIYFPDEQFTRIIKQWNTTLFEADPEAGTIQVVFLDDDGNVITTELLEL